MDQGGWGRRVVRRYASKLKGSHNDDDDDRSKNKKSSAQVSNSIAASSQRDDLPIARLYASATHSSAFSPSPPPPPPKSYPMPATKPSPNRAKTHHGVIDATEPPSDILFSPSYFQVLLAYEPPRTPSPDSSGLHHQPTASNSHRPRRLGPGSS
jgi:hypothetical protein